MEYGSEYDWLANGPFLRDTDTGFVPGDWQLYRSGRDAMKAFARIAGRKKVLLPALCCESMILPFTANGYEVIFYRLNSDFTGSEADVRQKLSPGAVLLYIRYFGIKPFTDEFLQSLRASGDDIVIVEDRTHDVLCPRDDEGFMPDATLSSLRKWAALPDGGMLETKLGRTDAAEDSRFADIRRWAMEKKSLYLESYDPELKSEFLPPLKNADNILDESGEPVKIGPENEKLLRRIDFEALFSRRRENALLLKKLLSPLADAGKLRFVTGAPENSTLYFPILLEERGRVQGAMAQKGIFCPVIWPLPEEAEGVCPVTEYVTSHMLAIPCDQRYDAADMHFVAATLTEILGANE